MRHLKYRAWIKILPSNSNEEIAGLCHQNNYSGRRVIKRGVGVDQTECMHQRTQLWYDVRKIAGLEILLPGKASKWEIL